jgi:cytochrome bd-type quinol oxidase subunit 1
VDDRVIVQTTTIMKVIYICYIFSFQLVNQMNEAVARRRDKLFNMGVVMQPMVVIVGDLNNVQVAYVVLDDTVWKM